MGESLGRACRTYSVPWKILEGVRFRYDNCSHVVYLLLGKDSLDTINK